MLTVRFRYFVVFLSLLLFAASLVPEPSRAQAQQVYKYLYRSVILKDGYTMHYLACPIYDAGDNSSSSECGDFYHIEDPKRTWQSHDMALPRLGGNPNQTYGAWAQFVYVQNGQAMLSQSLTSSDGWTSWGRICTINPDNTSDELAPISCPSNWFEVPNNEPQNSLSQYMYRWNGQWWLRQVRNTPLTNPVVKYRDCPSNTVNGILWSQCTAWTTFGPNDYFENTEYRIFSQNVENHRQSFLYTTVYKTRLCPSVNGPGFDCSATGWAWGEIPPSNVAHAGHPEAWNLPEVAYDAYVLSLNSPLATIPNPNPSPKGSTYPYY
jgi:hypothetical protein